MFAEGEGDGDRWTGTAWWVWSLGLVKLVVLLRVVVVRLEGSGRSDSDWLKFDAVSGHRIGY